MKPNDFWYTPHHVLKRVEEFFGGAYFDPCPVNPTFDGLARNWDWNCFINPPYSATLKNAFIAKGIQQFKTAPGHRFLWLMNYANSRALWELHRYASAICVPQYRIHFVPGHPALSAGDSPRYDNIFILWGNATGFADAFQKLGKVYVNA